MATQKPRTIFEAFAESDSKKPYHIINGPGKYDLLILALIQKERVTFTIKEVKELELKAEGICHVCVVSATRLDQHPGEWLIDGYFEGGYYDFLYHNYGLSFKALYEIRSRQGWIEPEESEPIVSKKEFPPKLERHTVPFDPEIGRYHRRY